MFRKKVQTISDVIRQAMTEGGLDTPLKQKRIIDAWDIVAGQAVANYTVEKFIKNQTLFVKISNPALRSDLSMMRTELVQKLNTHVGSFVISEIRIF